MIGPLSAPAFTITPAVHHQSASTRKIVLRGNQKLSGSIVSAVSQWQLAPARTNGIAVAIGLVAGIGPTADEKSGASFR